MQLSAELGLAKGTVFGILQTLRVLGLVERDPESRKYQLGAGVLRLGMSYLDASELRRHALRWSGALAERSGETVRVGILHDGQVLVLHHVFRRADGDSAFPTGAVLPLHATAMGKVLLAALPDADRQRATAELRAFTPSTIIDPDQLARGLGEARERGWAASVEELVEGVAALAAPIVDRRGATVGALSISGPTGRLCRAGEPNGRMVTSIRDFAGAISRDLGARPWELSLPEQLRAELGSRLGSELERRGQLAHELREDLRERRAVWSGMWSAQHPRGLTTDVTRSELEQTIRRQASELAVTERQLAELRARLRESEPAAPEGRVTMAAGEGPVARDMPPAPVLAVSPDARVAALRSGEVRLFAEEFAAQLLHRWQLALREQFRGELGQCLEAEVGQLPRGRSPRLQQASPETPAGTRQHTY